MCNFSSTNLNRRGETLGIFFTKVAFVFLAER